MRYIIAKPIESRKISRVRQREAKDRRERQEEFVRDCDARDAHLAWADDKYYRKRVALGMNFKVIHSEIRR
ncbi:MAG: hypothetical protein DMF60_02640 [Acidobacteria bacterium]|nr:MAG: hypothetical protein DMF60_02640 [Acidobacteriota bacterium]